MARKSGKLIVLAGIDGSGKATQTELLLARLRKEGCEAEGISFPRHEIFGLPRPDLSVLLHLPHTMAQELVDRKGARSYTGNRKRDIHEQDLAHLEKAEATYLEIASMEPNWVTVECTDKGKLLSPENISEELWERVRRVIEARTPRGSSTAPAPTDT